MCSNVISRNPCSFSRKEERGPWERGWEHAIFVEYMTSHKESHTSKRFFQTSWALLCKVSQMADGFSRFFSQLFPGSVSQCKYEFTEWIKALKGGKRDKKKFRRNSTLSASRS